MVGCQQRVLSLPDTKCSRSGFEALPYRRVMTALTLQTITPLVLIVLPVATDAQC